MLTTSTVNPIDITVEVSFFRLSKKSHGKFSLADIILSISVFLKSFSRVQTKLPVRIRLLPGESGKVLNGKKHRICTVLNLHTNCR